MLKQILLSSSKLFEDTKLKRVPQLECKVINRKIVICSGERYISIHQVWRNCLAGPKFCYWIVHLLGDLVYNHSHKVYLWCKFPLTSQIAPVVMKYAASVVSNLFYLYHLIPENSSTQPGFNYFHDYQLKRSWINKYASTVQEGMQDITWHRKYFLGQKLVALVIIYP